MSVYGEVENHTPPHQETPVVKRPANSKFFSIDISFQKNRTVKEYMEQYEPFRDAMVSH